MLAVTATDRANIVRDRRMDLGLSRSELANKVGMSRQWIVGFENDRASVATIGHLTRLCADLRLHVGMDTAGAIQLAVQDEAILGRPEEFESVSHRDIAEHIRQLRVYPDAWLFPGYESGSFSLAGAQSKFALARMSDGS